MSEGHYLNDEEFNKLAVQALTMALKTRDPGLVRAELVDALRDYAQIFREKSAMEIERAENVEAMAAKIEAGGSASMAKEVPLSQEWAHRYKLLEMKFNEYQMKCNRLVLEHGDK